MRDENLKAALQNALALGQTFAQRYGQQIRIDPNTLDQMATQCAALSEAFSICGERAREAATAVLEQGE